jgi:hypothetical protein
MFDFYKILLIFIKKKYLINIIDISSLIFFSFFIYSLNLLIINNIILNKASSINRRIIIIYI